MSNIIEQVTEGKAAVLENGAAAPPLGVYVSPWTSDSNTTNHNTVFQHGLNAIPLSVKVFFSADTGTVYPVLWPWNSAYTGNPVSISMNENTITLAIFQGAPLHGFWDPAAGWTTFAGGYWMVIASTTPS